MIAPFVHWRSVSCYRKSVPLTWRDCRGQKSCSNTSFSCHRILRLWVQDEDRSLEQFLMETCSCYVASQSKWHKELQEAQIRCFPSYWVGSIQKLQLPSCSSPATIAELQEPNARLLPRVKKHLVGQAIRNWWMSILKHFHAFCIIRLCM